MFVTALSMSSGRSEGWFREIWFNGIGLVKVNDEFTEEEYGEIIRSISWGSYMSIE